MQRNASIIFNKWTSVLVSAAIVTNHWYRRQQLISKSIQIQSNSLCRTLRPILPLMRSAQLAQSDDKDWMKTVYERCINSIVHLMADDLISEDECFSGTGWIVDANEGLIITNYHIVRDFHYYLIQLEYSYKIRELLAGIDRNDPVDNSQLMSSWWAQVVYVEPHLDLAMLKLPAVKPGTLDQLAIAQKDVTFGDEVMFIGVPKSIERSVGIGTVMYIYFIQLNDAYYSYGHFDWPDNQLFMNISTSTATGSSGSPVLNSSGQVVGSLFSGGFNESTVTRKDDLLGFVNRAKNKGNTIFDQLVKQRQLLYSGQPFIGMKLIYKNKSIIVNRFMPYTDVGIGNELKLNDKIVEINENPVKNLNDVRDVMNRLSIGQSIELKFMRGNSHQQKTVNIKTENVKNCCLF